MRVVAEQGRLTDREPRGTVTDLLGKAMLIRPCTLLVIVPLLAACGYAAEQGRDRADVPESVARVLDHELSYGTLWLSEEDEPERAAAEFLESVFGWSTDAARVGPGPSDEEWAGDDAEVFDDPDRATRRRIPFEAESPDGRPVLLGARAGESTPPDVQPEQVDDEQWRVVDVVIDPQPPVRWLSLDVDADNLDVHEIPDEQEQSVLLLYQDGESESFLLDDDELEPGAEVDALDLSALGVALEEHRSTGLVVHFDADGLVLGAGGGNLQSAPGR